MNIVGLFILAASLLATVWAGKIELWIAAVVFFIAATISDSVGIATKVMQARVAEVMLNGLAEGQAKKKLLDKIGRAAREAGKQTGRDSNSDDSN